MKNFCLPILLSILIQSPFIVLSQVPHRIVFQKLYGGILYDNGIAMVMTEENAFVLAGTTQSPDGEGKGNHGFENEDLLVIKVAADGRIMWRTMIGGSGKDEIVKMIQTRDKGYALIGTTDSNNGDVSGNHGKMDMWLVKIDELGRLQWNHCFGGPANDQGFAISQTYEGDYLIGGETGSRTGDIKYWKGGLDSWIARVKADGTILWSKTLGGLGNERAIEVIELDRQRTLVVNSTNSTDHDVANPLGEKDVWVMALSRNMDVEWQQCLGGTGFDDAITLVKNKEGNFVFAGTTFSTDVDIRNNHGRGDFWVFELDDEGNLIWSNTYGGTRNEGAAGIQATPDGGYLVYGSSNSENGPVKNFKGHYDGLLIKIDATGTEQWSMSCGGEDYEAINSALQLPNGDWMALGYAESVNADLAPTGKMQGNDYWFMRISDKIDPSPFSTRNYVTGFCYDKETANPLRSKITLTKNSTLETVLNIESGSDGYYKLYLPADAYQTTYSINITTDGYMFHGDNITQEALDISPEVRIDGPLEPIKIGKKVVLNHIYFDAGAWSIRDESIPELNRLLRFLVENLYLQIEIGGHTDSTGNAEEKDELSLRRAESVRDWMLREDIYGYRMSVKGYGMSQPVAPEDSERGRQKNRRVEVLITGKK